MSLKSAQTAKIGKQFKSMRVSLGISEEEASTKTFINIDYIKAIESGDYDIFPARMFALRYFEKYSAFLGIKKVFFDIYDAKNIPDNDDENITKSWIKNIYPQIIIAVISVLLVTFIFKLLSSSDQSNFSQETIEDNPALLFGNDQKPIADLSAEMKPTIQNSSNQPSQTQLSEFIVDEGIINNLSLSFIEASWVEIYQGSKMLTYKLFQTNEKFEISITPPFKIIVGNAGGIVGFYNQSEINFTQVANELNVSLIEVKDE